jgi:hypothetical protein
MRNNKVEIIDKNGQKLRLYISIVSNLGIIKDSFLGEKEDYRMTELTGSVYFKQFYGQIPGRWKALNSESGLIQFFGGSVLHENDNYKELTTNSIYLLNLEETWGIELFNYWDFWGVNDYGEGTIAQTWVKGLAAGRFTWSIID